MVLSNVVFEIFNVKRCRDIEIRVEIRVSGHSRSLKVIPFDRFGMVSY